VELGRWGACWHLEEIPREIKAKCWAKDGTVLLVKLICTFIGPFKPYLRINETNQLILHINWINQT